MREPHSTFSEERRVNERETLSGFHELEANQPCQPEKSGAEQTKRAGFGNGWGRGSAIVVRDRNRAGVYVLNGTDYIVPAAAETIATQGRQN